MRVLVTGATGYVGHHVCGALVAAGHSVVGLARRGGRSSTASGVDLGLQPGVEYREGDVASGAGLSEAARGAEAVVHLVGIIQEKGEQTFQRVHVDGTRRVLEAAKAAGAERYLHMSALGARAGSKSRYSSTKFEAEDLVRASGLPWTIFRPSLIFGRGDDFFGRVLRNLVSQGPVVPVIGRGDFPFRPLWAGDVGAAFAQALQRPATVGQTYELVGPKEYTFTELLDLELSALGKSKPKLGVPVALMNLAVPAMNLLPNPPITKDQYAQLLEGSTADPGPMRRAFDLELRPLEGVLPEVVGRGA